MIRRWLVVPLALSVIVAVSGTAMAQRVPSAKVGDRMATLVTGLTPVTGNALGSCPASAPVLIYAHFLVPPRVDVPVFGPLGNHDDENASLLGFFIGNRFVAGIAFDEQRLGVPAMVYADLDGKGLITNIWPAAEAPALCSIVQQLHYQP